MGYFDEAALAWDNEPRRVERAKAVAGEIIEAVPGLDRMNGLEFGCGTGLVSFHLKDHLQHITLVDNSQGMLDVLKQKIQDGNLKQMTPLLLDLSLGEQGYNGEFEIIYTVMALHHIQEIDTVVEAFSKLLQPSGYLCIVDLDEEDGSFHGAEQVPHNGFSREMLTEKLKKNGFTNIHWKIFYENSKKMEDGTERRYPLFFLAAQRI